MAALTPGALNAQSAAPTAAAALNRVISYRHAWMGDSTRVDACGAFESLGRPSTFPAGLTDPQRRFFSTSVGDCMPGRLSPAAQAAGRFVHVDSISTTHLTATVILTVRRGEYTHRETYSLVGRSESEGLRVSDVRFWGATQSTSPPRQPEPVPLEERAQALNEVIGERYARISSQPLVDACSMFLVLDRDTRFRERLGEYQRRWLSSELPESCPASLKDHRMGEFGWYLREISRSGPDELTVIAVQYVVGRGGHSETYVLYHGYGDPKLWRLREIRIGSFSFD
ncbi:MAG TPA: hypothetical protein VFS20_33420 [Longimicrobium sp.]|nr:hypothetical protein [Longimicrobium sp.]